MAVNVRFLQRHRLTATTALDTAPLTRYANCAPCGGSEVMLALTLQTMAPALHYRSGSPMSCWVRVWVLAGIVPISGGIGVGVAGAQQAPVTAAAVRLS